MPPVVEEDDVALRRPVELANLLHLEPLHELLENYAGFRRVRAQRMWQDLWLMYRLTSHTSLRSPFPKASRSECSVNPERTASPLRSRSANEFW
jgi:hypothetical protein